MTILKQECKSGLDSRIVRSNPKELILCGDENEFSPIGTKSNYIKPDVCISREGLKY